MEENIQKNSTTKDNKKSKIRMILVIVFILLFLVISYISLRGSYLEYKELGQNYEQVFFTNMQYRYTIYAVCFVAIYILMYLINRGIRKGVKIFFEKEKSKMPKLPNKSISLIVATLLSVIMGSAIMQKIILYIISSNVSRETFTYFSSLNLQFCLIHLENSIQFQFCLFSYHF